MNLRSQVESLLFISNKPLSVKDLTRATKAEIKQVKNSLAELEKEYNQSKKGIRLMTIEDKFQLVSHPDNARLVEKFIRQELTGELTRPSLETLTIIAYRGPITKPELEIIRGVNCGLILRNLLMRGLIEEKPNKKTGQPAYNITFEFLQYLGLTNVKALPDYEKLSNSQIIDKLLESAV